MHTLTLLNYTPFSIWGIGVLLGKVGVLLNKLRAPKLQEHVITYANLPSSHDWSSLNLRLHPIFQSGMLIRIYVSLILLEHFCFSASPASPDQTGANELVANWFKKSKKSPKAIANGLIIKTNTIFSTAWSRRSLNEGFFITCSRALSI